MAPTEADIERIEKQRQWMWYPALAGVILAIPGAIVLGEFFPDIGWQFVGAWVFFMLGIIIVICSLIFPALYGWWLVNSASITINQRRYPVAHTEPKLLCEDTYDAYQAGLLDGTRTEDETSEIANARRDEVAGLSIAESVPWYDLGLGGGRNWFVWSPNAYQAGVLLWQGKKVVKMGDNLVCPYHVILVDADQLPAAVRAALGNPKTHPGFDRYTTPIYFVTEKLLPGWEEVAREHPQFQSATIESIGLPAIGQAAGSHLVSVLGSDPKTKEMDWSRLIPHIVHEFRTWLVNQPPMRLALRNGFSSVTYMQADIFRLNREVARLKEDNQHLESTNRVLRAIDDAISRKRAAAIGAHVSAKSPGWTTADASTGAPPK